MRKAVYFFCTDYERDEVAPRVLNYLKENYDLKLSDFKFANRDVYEYHDDRGNLFSFVETDKVLSYDYDLYIPLLNKYFKDIFISCTAILFVLEDDGEILTEFILGFVLSK